MANRKMGGLSVLDLKVDGITSPLAVDHTNMTFSWRLECSLRGKKQTAFRVKMAESIDQLALDDCLVWDSGRTAGNRSRIRYDGPQLPGNRRYWWSVGVWDESGVFFSSTPSHFDTGLLEQDWKASWIWKPGAVIPNDFCYFRKSFTLEKRPVRAKIFVTAHHFFQLYVNGTKVGGYGSPAPTLPTHRKLYLAYEVNDLLREGANRIGAIVHYLGGSGQNYVNGTPGFLLQAEWEDANGTIHSVLSDTTWEVLKEIPHHTGTPYQQNRRISAVETYDARKLDEQWHLPGHEGPDTEAAVIADLSGQQWPLMPQQLPEGAVEQIVLPNPVGIQEIGRQVFDAGKIVSGWPRLIVKGREGVKLTLRYSEDLDETGGVKHNVCNETSHHYFDEYMMAGKKMEQWEPDISYKAFRFVEVTGYPELLNEQNIRIVSAHTDLAYTGSFHCSNPLLNEIYAACIQTQKNNVLGQIVDCPHREQAQYLADSDLQAETLLYHFDGLPALDKLLADFTGAQREDGTFPFVFPSNVEHPDFDLHIPEWDLHFVTVLWKIYRYSGDTGYLQKHYKAAKRLMDGISQRTDELTGLVPKGHGWHISDWPYPTIDEEGQILTVENMKVFHNFGLLAEFAGLLGLPEDAEEFRSRRTLLGQAIRRHLFDTDCGLFADCSGSASRHQGVNALSLEYGLVPEEERSAVLDYIVEQGHQCKTVLSSTLLRVLFENGRENDAYRLLNNDNYPGWGYMIAKGYKTVWEGFDDIESHCHAWNGYPARLFAEYIVGIQCGKPGFEPVVIKPWIPDDLSFAEASIVIPAGKVRVRWERTGVGATVVIDLPANCSAEFVVPANLVMDDQHDVAFTGGSYRFDMVREE